MKNKILYAIMLILSGCNSVPGCNPAHKSQQQAQNIDFNSVQKIKEQYSNIDFNSAQDWVKNADANLATLDKLFSKFQKNISILEKEGLTPDKNDKRDFIERLYVPDINKETRLLYLDTFTGLGWTPINIIKNVKELQLITGNCLLEDIPCNEIPEKADVISIRYRKFIYDNREKTLKDLWESSLKKNIDLIKSEYCIQALIQITSMVDFNLSIDIFDNECPKVPEKNSLEAWKSMNAWFERNKDNLIWNDFLKRFFNKNGSFLEQFQLPKEAKEAVNSIMPDL